MATTTQAAQDKAIAAYPKADAKTKKTLESIFGAEIFQPKITDLVKTVADACKLTKIDASFLTSKTLAKDEIAYKSLKAIVAALNQGWVPDWKNDDEEKYYPWFDMQAGSKKTGFELRYVYYCCSHSDVSSRLCFRTRELAEYAVKQFLPVYKNYFTL